MTKREEQPVGIDDILNVDSEGGRYDGPEVIEDPADVARRLRRRSNMESLTRRQGERRRQVERKSDLDKIFER
ncbi:MAG: hypothetical protein H6741_17320 [Alphaproteobacteria bacterium]|nr:hypothetical protein [Alphaproteobacteria bacterium]MCB9794478.1 hypothetical protein [Alphaproteobacteria bacterium]